MNLDFLNKTSKSAKILIIINVSIYIFGILYSTYIGTGADNSFFAIKFGVVNISFLNGQFYRIFTAGFIHASLVHLLVNMYALFQLGKIAERIFDEEEFIYIYALSLLGSSLAVLFLSKAGITVGASGAILGLFGAIGASITLKTNYFLDKNNYVMNLAFIGLYSIFLGGISWQGHFGGFVVGYLVGYFILYAKKNKGFK